MTNEEQIYSLMRRIGALQRREADDWVRETGLTMAQGMALGFIGAYGDQGVIARDIAEQTGTTAASVASLVKGLTERGYITRKPSPEDSRRKLLFVTEEGAALLRDFEDTVNGAIHGQFDVLTKAEQKQLVTLLQRVADAMGDAE